MSRTYRNKRPRMRLGILSAKQYRNGKVRDGTPQYVSGGCHNRGPCTWCRDNRLHKHDRRAPLTMEYE